MRPTLLATLLLAAHGALAAAQDRPNIVVFLADDLGWRDVGAYGNAGIRTPHIDAIARAGLRVQVAIGTSPQCSPSRISMLSGRWPHTTRTEDLHTPLPEGERLLPFLLRERGYFTGHMAKTHYGPLGERQFEWYSPETASALPAFLDSAGARPFFLWVGFHDPHRPYERGAVSPPHSPARVTVPPWLADTPETRADLALYYDEIARMDGEIGRMMAELERRGLEDNTLVIFLSDNGAPFPREKGTLYDAGTRTPLLFAWRGVIPAGSVWSRGQVSTIDLAPTILEIAGAPIPANVQGRNARALLGAPDRFEGTRYAFSERNWHDCDEHQRSVRTTRFKLVRTDAYTELPLCTAADIGGSPSFLALRALAKAGRLTSAQRRLFEAPRARLELYDLASDPNELVNVADDPRYATEVRELARVLQEWMESTDDFPAWYRVRADHTDRITGVQVSPEIPPLRETDLPPPAERWGHHD